MSAKEVKDIISVLQQHTPVSSIKDSQILLDYFKNNGQIMNDLKNTNRQFQKEISILQKQLEMSQKKEVIKEPVKEVAPTLIQLNDTKESTVHTKFLQENQEKLEEYQEGIILRDDQIKTFKKQEMIKSAEIENLKVELQTTNAKVSELLNENTNIRQMAQQSLSALKSELESNKSDPAFDLELSKSKSEKEELIKLQQELTNQVAELKSELEESKSAIRNDPTLEESLTNLKSENEVLIKSQEALTAQINELQSQMTAKPPVKSDEDIFNLQSENHKLMKSHQDMIIQINALQLELESAKSEAHNESQLENELAALKSHNAQQFRAQQDLETQINMLKSELEAASSAVHNDPALESELSTLQTTNADLLQIKKNLENEISTLQAQLEASKVEVHNDPNLVLQYEQIKAEHTKFLKHDKESQQELERHIKELEADLLVQAKNAQDYSKLQSEYALLQQSKEEDSTVIRNDPKLEQDLAALKQQYHELVETNESATHQINHLKSELDSKSLISLDIPKLQAENKQLAHKNEELQSQITALQSDSSENDELISEVNKLNADTTTLKEQLKLAKDALSKNEQELSKISQDYANANKSNHEKESTISETLKRIEVLNKQTETHQIQFNKLQDQHTVVCSQYKQSLTELKTLQALHTALESKLTQLDKKYKEDLDEKTRQIQKQNQEATSQYKTLSDESHASIKKLRDELATTKTMLETHMQENQILHSEIGKVQREHSALKQHIDNQINQLTTQNEGYVEQIKQSKQIKDQMEQELRKTVAILEGSLKAKERQLTELEKNQKVQKESVVEYAVVVKELEGIKVQNGELTTQLSSLQQMIGECKTEIDRLKTGEQQLKQLNRSLKDELKNKVGATSGHRPSGSLTTLSLNQSKDGTKPGIPSPTLSSPVSKASNDPSSQSPVKEQLTRASRSPSMISVNTNMTAGGTGNDYLKLVLLKFAERRDVRPQLIPVLANLLGLTPEECGKLNKL